MTTGTRVSRIPRRVRGLIVPLWLALLSVYAPGPVAAHGIAFRQAVAESASADDTLTAFYRDRAFEGIWTGTDAVARDRRNALMAALSEASAHGLPAQRYDPGRVMAQLRAARTPAERGAMEVKLSSLLLSYARDVQTGVLTPASVVPLIKRDVPVRSGADTLAGFANSSPAGFLRSLPPRSPEYVRLMAEKMRLEDLLARGGYGPSVPIARLGPGATGGAVVALRDKLIAMGHMERSASPTYDDAVERAVKRFQESHGLEVDGVAGDATLAAINQPLERRLQSIIVAMERERWINHPRGDRHIWVNLTDFTATIVDDGRTTFTTRSVIGARETDRRTPEFSDVMEYMVINPSWYVPRSIVVKEYLPKLQRNANAVRHLDVTDRSGRIVPRGSVNASRYTARTFPYSMRQGPGDDNALGLVKFLFPNRYNIYLHDTPSRSLFDRSVRAFSHGCIRLNDPFEFAYALLARQEDDPQGFFQSRLRGGAETRVTLDDPVPVHIVYRTAFTHVTGRLQFRDDIYGRDGKIWSALAREGVAVRAVQG